MIDTFVAACGGDRVDDRTWLAARLEDVVTEAREAWPELAVDRFVEVLGAGFAAQSSPARVWFERLRPADLYLATAVTLGVHGAAEAFEEAWGADLVRVAQRFAGARHPVDDLVQGIREKLLVGVAGRPPRIGEYSGQGFLQNWLRVAAVRICLDAVKSGAQQRREDGSDALEAADLVDDPELAFLKTTYRAQFREAFGAAVGQLDRHERTLLKMVYLHGLGIDAVGAVLHVHRATAARRVARARETLLVHTRAALQGRLSVDDAELDSIMGLIGSQLEVSLERLLRSTIDP